MRAQVLPPGGGGGASGPRPREPLCRNLRGYVGVAADGGYAEYTALPAGNLLPVPEGLGAVEATAIPAAIAPPFPVSRRAGTGPAAGGMIPGGGGGGGGA